MLWCHTINAQTSSRLIIAQHFQHEMRKSNNQHQMKLNYFNLITSARWRWFDLFIVLNFDWLVNISTPPALSLSSLFVFGFFRLMSNHLKRFGLIKTVEYHYSNHLAWIIFLECTIQQYDYWYDRVPLKWLDCWIIISMSFYQNHQHLNLLWSQ